MNAPSLNDLYRGPDAKGNDGNPQPKYESRQTNQEILACVHARDCTPPGEGQEMIFRVVGQ